MSKEFSQVDRSASTPTKKTYLSQLHSWLIMTRVYDRYWNLRAFVRVPFDKLKKLYDWQVNVLNEDYDFEAQCLFSIMEYKLKRVLLALETGHAIQEDKDMKALRLAIKLAGRLKDDLYGNKEYSRHDRKWGKLNMDIDRVASRDARGKPTSYHCDMSRSGVVTKEDEEQEKKEFLQAIQRIDAAVKRDESRFYGILQTYLRKWWD